MIIRKAIRSDGGITGTLKKQTPLNKKIKGVKRAKMIYKKQWQNGE